MTTIGATIYLGAPATPETPNDAEIKAGNEPVANMPATAKLRADWRRGNRVSKP